jgi:hypothetical protein
MKEKKYMKKTQKIRSKKAENTYRLVFLSTSISIKHWLTVGFEEVFQSAHA